MERRWAIALVAVAIAIVALLAVAPFARTSTCIAVGDGPNRCTTESTSLLEHEGSSVLVVLAIPVALAAIAALARSRRARMVVAVVLTTFMLLAMMTIGVFLLPIVALAWVLAYKTSASSLAK